MGARFLDFLPSDLCVWQRGPESATLFMRVFSLPSIGSMDTFAMVADSKVFIVARNKHVVPKQRRVERLPSGYSVRESRDDSQGSYWYVVTALEVVGARNP
jgi:hypothetical protein